MFITNFTGKQVYYILRLTISSANLTLVLSSVWQSLSDNSLQHVKFRAHCSRLKSKVFESYYPTPYARASFLNKLEQTFLSVFMAGGVTGGAGVRKSLS